MTVNGMIAQHPFLDKAKAFAAAAHGACGQVRKYTGEPYIVHPISVANRVWEHTHDIELTAAAFMHDVVEDTSVPLSLIEQEFGTTVARYVDEVTNRSKKEHGNRAYRKKIDCEHLAKASPQAKTLKLCDIIDNVTDIKVQDPGYAIKYCGEKREVLKILREGDSTLWAWASELVKENG